MKLTNDLLRKLVLQEMASMKAKLDSTEDAAKDTEEVDADELADTLEKKVDVLKALKIEEKRLETRLKKIRESRARVVKSLVKKG